ncbi:FAD-dependent oxidoreductase [Sphingobium sp. EM0848]|uniref:FAD-dependent oxidoreductase n=1 Tax=Sphingobium sp. EM0848 TaxID=2743473 RepID=UPI00159CA24E|nr:FAD-dependent oxidoreductase [Sphingobium sp. EM0848]
MDRPLDILIVGGGFSGLSAAIALCRRGHRVDLVEIDGEWTTYGAGISIGGATLRALKTLGVLDRFLEQGFAGDGTELRTPDDRVIAALPTPRIAGPDVPGNAAVMRPVLARILAEAALAAGVSARLGCTFTALDSTDGGVEAQFTDGTRGRYDLVIGADGLRSAVRALLFPDSVQPRYNGQGVWRAVLPRPDHVTGTILWVGDDLKVGVNPVSRDEIYLFVNENRAVNERIDAAEFLPRLRGLLDAFPAQDVRAIRDALSPDSHIIFRPIEGMLLPRPWHVGPVVLIGDAVHATTPHLASGAGIGIEDAIVLAEELDKVPGVGAASVETALTAFEERRWDRCRMVVENSGRLGEIEVQHGDKAEHAALMRESFLALAGEI